MDIYIYTLLILLTNVFCSNFVLLFSNVNILVFKFAVSLLKMVHKIIFHADTCAMRKGEGVRRVPGTIK